MEPVEYATEEELLEKIKLLNFVEQCKKSGWDKLLARYDICIPEIDVGTELKKIKATVALLSDNIDWVLEEEEYKNFTEAIAMWSSDSSPTKDKAGLPAASYAWNRAKTFFFPDGVINQGRLARACSAGLMGDFGKAFMNYKHEAETQRKKTEELMERAKKLREEAAARNTNPSFMTEVYASLYNKSLKDLELSASGIQKLSGLQPYSNWISNDDGRHMEW